METLYRKYRPIDFDTVVGQDAIVKTLKNQIANGTVAHAYLFSGTRGTGKTTVAKIFARAVNCLNELAGNPCNECEVCKASLAGADYNIMELDAASNGNVEKVRMITDSMQYPPINGEKYKVYIIDEAHALTGYSKEAFLKSLEEPPEYVIYILATTDPNKLPETILSRCQKYNFRRIGVDTIVSYMKNICEKESIDIEDDALTFIAEKSDGSMRESISKLDRCRSYTKDRLTMERVQEILGIVDDDEFAKVLKAVNEGNVEIAFDIVSDIVEKGKDINQFTSDLIWHIRNVLLAKNLKNAVEPLGITKLNFEKLKAESEKISKDVLIFFIELSKTLNVMRYDENRRVILETALIKLSHPEMCFIESAVMARVKKLEDVASGGTYVRVENIKSESTSKGESDEKKTIKEKDEKISEIKLSKITFDEIKLVSDNWQAIKAVLDLTSKSILNNSTIVPASDKEQGIVHVLLDEVDYNILNDMGKIEKIEEALNASSKDILKKEVIYKLINNKNTKYAKKVTFKLEDAFDKIVGMEIGIEDDK